ncbi:hypothetical protein R3P38DRAFT_2805560 [Favolaschia claudopus]|uniref:Uncharacterized protein n=1 Tax=Favolaschia claudopus TaxID=2862362 RepID=A0AAV9ZMK4_9AGAR
MYSTISLFKVCERMLTRGKVDETIQKPPVFGLWRGTNKKFWDSERFYGYVKGFNEPHTTFDSTYRPTNYLRLNSRKRRHPGHPQIRRREEEDEDYVEELPPTKRQATTRILRPQGKDSQTQKKVIPGKVVKSGRNWDIVEMDEEE